MALHGSLRRGLFRVQLAAIPWSLLCLELSKAEYRPSGPSPFTDPYLAQALLLPLLLTLQWAIMTAWVLRSCKRQSIPVSLESISPALASSLGATLLLTFVLPDYLIWRLEGFESMSRILPLTAPLCLVVLVGTGSLILERQLHLSRFDAVNLYSRALFWGSLPILALVR